MMPVVDQASGEMWSYYCADAVEWLPDLPAASVDLVVTSPPFADLYVYTGTTRDLGNSRTDAEFFEQFGYITRELHRVLKPGRVAAIHVMDVPATLIRDGYIGLKDFSGDVIRHFVSQGFVFDARIPIDKNQQAQSIRTHAKGLTKSQLWRDRSWMRPAFPDYVLKFRKPGENVVRVVAGDVDMETWIEWANPSWPNEHDRCADAGAFATWYGIKEADTLSRLRDKGDDGRHVCPLQLGTIERAVRLWTNAGEVTLDPFGGIGSVGYTSILHGRRHLGVELKREWWAEGVRNLRRADEKVNPQPDLLSLIEAAG
jgi:DNA modification methylase